MINLSDRYLKKKRGGGRKIPNNPRFKKNKQIQAIRENRDYLRTIKVKQNIPKFGRNIDTYVWKKCVYACQFFAIYYTLSPSRAVMVSTLC